MKPVKMDLSLLWTSLCANWLDGAFLLGELSAFEFILLFFSFSALSFIYFSLLMFLIDYTSIFLIYLSYFLPTYRSTIIF